MADHITPAQIRGARAMLDWSMVDLAKAAGVSVSTVKRIEAGQDGVLSDDIRHTVVLALERVGVTFLDGEGQGVGLRLLGTETERHRSRREGE